jgi:glycosyltransferase involved in cell wall biosynthesis
MRIALIADAYPPLRTSCAVQMRDLAHALAGQGHAVTVLVPQVERGAPWILEDSGGVQVLRVAALQTKDRGYAMRVLAELLLPVMLWRGLRRSPLGSVRWEALAWYSPTIFLGPLVSWLKRASGCRSYLILRDIFPEWAVDMGLLKRGLPYRFFKMIERYQYSVADVIAVQSPSNLPYLGKWSKAPGRRLEVLHNWLADAPDAGSSITVAQTPLAGRTIFVYAGNMGVAQDMDFVLGLATVMQPRSDVGFLFVGRGSEVSRLRSLAAERGLDNVVFRDEVDPREMPGLLAQCHIGIVALDSRHRTHNVPGKFLAYVQAGLPVLARINPGNDLAALIESRDVGRVYVGDSPEAFQAMAMELCGAAARRSAMSANARALAADTFSVAAAAAQVATALEGR